eukprot:13288817-Alexandrium_andersonii.AAC.1
MEIRACDFRFDSAPTTSASSSRTSGFGASTPTPSSARPLTGPGVLPSSESLSLLVSRPSG